MKILYVTSDNTSTRHYELDDTDSKDILELAMDYGRGETGEMVNLYDGEERIAQAYWDNQYRKYRKCK